MTDNRTTELRISEPLRGFIRHQSNRAYIDGGQAKWLTDIADKIDAKHEQAVAATLGSEPPYDELIRCLENDWNISASWDGLRKFWCIELTEEGVKLRDAVHGTLTAEQVREAHDKHWHDLPAEYDMPEAVALPEYSYDWQAIADELNAALGCGECSIEERNGDWYCTGCGEMVGTCDTASELYIDGNAVDLWSYCPRCGKAVKR